MKFWVVVPAAGIGRRFGTDLAKQYQVVAGQPLVCHTLSRLLTCKPAQIVVVVNPGDSCWKKLPVFFDPMIRTVPGGETRAESVQIGLQDLNKQAGRDDWVLIHDVARPCITRSDVDKLLSRFWDHPVGGILAAPVADTLKRVDDRQLILGTEDRSHLWSAYTPQMFRYGLLVEALELALATGAAPTDEAGALERMGLVPGVVPGRRDNIKLTVPEDLHLIEAVLRQQDAESKARRRHPVQS